MTFIFLFTKILLIIATYNNFNCTVLLLHYKFFVTFRVKTLIPLASFFPFCSFFSLSPVKNERPKFDCVYLKVLKTDWNAKGPKWDGTKVAGPKWRNWNVVDSTKGKLVTIRLKAFWKQTMTSVTTKSYCNRWKSPVL